MPTVEALKERAARLRKRMAEKKDALGAAKVRDLKKRIKRAQRRARKQTAAAKRVEEKKQKKQKKAEG